MDVDPKSLARGHEQRDAKAAWILGIIVFLVVFGLSIHGILAGFLSALTRMPPHTDGWQPIARAGRQSIPPEPRLQVSAPADLRVFRAREELELHSYGWINRTASVVRIPIEQAMELVLQEGLPTRTATNQAQSGPSTYQLILQRQEHREPEIKQEK